MAMSAVVVVIFRMLGITMAGNNDHRVMVVVMVPILIVTWRSGKYDSNNAQALWNYHPRGIHVVYMSGNLIKLSIIRKKTQY